MCRIDDTGFGNIRVLQRKGYGYGLDAVLLAAFAAGETGADGIRQISGRGKPDGCDKIRVADLGTDRPPVRANQAAVRRSESQISVLTVA